MLRDLPRPISRSDAFDHPDWIFELQHDGFRVLAIREEERSSLLSRRGNELLPQFPEIAKALENLPDAIIDGELVVLGERGRSLFHELRERCSMRTAGAIATGAMHKPAVLFAFDLLWFKGKDMRKLPLLKRKATLLEILPKLERISYCQHMVETGRRLFQAAQQLGLEGIVAKRANASYPRSLSADWIKIKTTMGRAAHDERVRLNEWKDP